MLPIKIVLRMARRFVRSLLASRGVHAIWSMLRCFAVYYLTVFGISFSEREVMLRLTKLRAIVDISESEIFAYWRIWHEHAYEALAEFRAKHGCTMDIGANVGFYAMRRAITYEDLQVYAFEPSRPAFSRLKRNIETNRLSNVLAFNHAIGNHSGSIRFDVAQPSIRSCVSENGSVEVPCKTLDDVVREHKLSHVDSIKINTEGYEVFVLQGAKATLQRVSRVVLELHGAEDKHNRIQTLLQDSGFHLATKKDNLWYFVRHV